MNMIHMNGRPMFQLKKIGRGGSSEVFQVITRDSFEIFALKKMTVPLSHDANARKKALEPFENEIDLLCKLRSKPFCIQMVDHEVTQIPNSNTLSILMLFECGDIDLSHLLKAHPKGCLSNICSVKHYWSQMLLAVDTVHSFRIVHGDLKPANFLMVKGELKLIDFGIAKQIATNNTTHISRDTQIGTLNFICPEALIAHNGQSECYKLGRSADVWSLGCILHQMCFGKTPFSHLQFVQKLSAIASKSCAKLIQRHPDPFVYDVVVRCLMREPSERISIAGLLKHYFLCGIKVDKAYYRGLRQQAESKKKKQTQQAHAHGQGQ